MTFFAVNLLFAGLSAIRKIRLHNKKRPASSRPFQFLAQFLAQPLAEGDQ
jgi:hypothetical protein